jgi:hypothetical protein
MRKFFDLGNDDDKKMQYLSIKIHLVLLLHIFLGRYSKILNILFNLAIIHTLNYLR